MTEDCVRCSGLGGDQVTEEFWLPCHRCDGTGVEKENNPKETTMSNNTNNTNNFGPEQKIAIPEQEMVPMQQGFVKTHDSVESSFTHPETGNPVIAYEQVPRGLEMASHENWQNTEYLAEMLGLKVGTNVRVTRTGTEIRDLYFSKVQGGVNPRTGKNYAWLKFGQLFTKLKQDPETGDERMVSWVQVGIKPYVPQQKVAQDAQEPRDDAQAAKEATDAIENL